VQGFAHDASTHDVGDSQLLRVVYKQDEETMRVLRTACQAAICDYNTKVEQMRSSGMMLFGPQHALCVRSNACFSEVFLTLRYTLSCLNSFRSGIYLEYWSPSQSCKPRAGRFECCSSEVLAVSVIVFKTS